jgi:glycosyltransferase involved in cell wall biosynthesis
MSPPRLAILCDYPEENWVSMNLVAEMLHRGLRDCCADRIVAEPVCPPFRRRASFMPGIRDNVLAFNFDRLANRLRDYPRYLRSLRPAFDAFHVADHSYAALVHALPAERTGVFCHDLDAFRSILDPQSHRRPRWFRAMAAHVLKGMQKAAVVFYTTDDVARQIRRHGLVDPARLVQAPLGVAPEFVPDESVPPPRIDSIVAQAARAGPFLLHVGSCIRRKRIDVLLDVLAIVRRADPRVRLIKVGGAWSRAQLAQQARLGVADAIAHLQDIDRHALAWLYRRAAAVLITSESEGFGLPVIEALACAAPVVASDIPVLREVGGCAVNYCAVADVDAWASEIHRIVQDQLNAPPTRAARLARASIYSWSNHARIIAETYLKLLDERRGA